VNLPVAVVELCRDTRDHDGATGVTVVAV